MDEISKRSLKLWFVFLVAVLAIIGVFLLPPIPQDPGYHDFADRRFINGIPNFWNVVSNAPFIIVGFLGILLLVQRPVEGCLPGIRPACFVFFSGVFLTGIGSGYYHLGPSNETLFWDRLPMTISFMAFFSIIIGGHLSPVLGHRLLWPLVLAGIISIAYWYITEMQGQGDLRPYALVQFLPVILIPMIMILFKSRLNENIYLWAVIVAYIVSKIAELLDGSIYGTLGVISGHSLKHIIAAVGAGFLYLALRRRALTGTDAQEPVPEC